MSSYRQCWCFGTFPAIFNLKSLVFEVGLFSYQSKAKNVSEVGVEMQKKSTLLLGAHLQKLHVRVWWNFPKSKYIILRYSAKTKCNSHFPCFRTLLLSVRKNHRFQRVTWKTRTIASKMIKLLLATILCLILINSSDCQEELKGDMNKTFWK